jgi:hypothetical protein
MGIITLPMIYLIVLRMNEVNEMKKTWIIGCLLVMLTFVISAGYVISQTNYSNQINNDSVSVINQPSLPHLPQIADSFGSISHSMNLHVPINANPEKILVYKTVPPNTSRSRIEEYAKIFNVNGTFREGTHAISLKSDDEAISVEIGKESGNIRYTLTHRPKDALDSPDMLPSDDDAARIATQFLKERDLYPEGATLGKIKRQYAVFIDDKGNDIPRHGRIVVWFSRKLNNLDVKGTQLYVEVGGHGDVIGYLANWREYTPVGEYPVKSPESAFEDMKQEGLRTTGENPRISITNATLAYRTKAGADVEEYLEPIWVFTGTASYKNTQSEPVSRYMPALINESVKSHFSS